MSAKSKIEWTASAEGTPGSTWNPVRGCSRVSRGCEHCYAERMAARFVTGPITRPGPYSQVIGLDGRWNGTVELIEKALKIPPHWKKPRRIFVNSMSDTFHEALPDAAIDRILSVMALCPQHTFMVLTKRAERMHRYLYFRSEDRGQQAARILNPIMRSVWPLPSGRTFPACLSNWPLPNVWLGVSVEDRSQLHRIDQLRETPAALRFLSLEPLLEDLGALDLRGIGQVIVGGESGPGARPMNLAWARSIRKQCLDSGTNFFMKQMGSWWARQENRDPDRWVRVNGKGSDPNDWPPDLQVREMPEAPCR